MDCAEAWNHLFKVHSTAYYLKAVTSAQIRASLLAGLRLHWSDVADSIGAFKVHVVHEHAWKAQGTINRSMLWKIDIETSITMSSKLAYQLTKLAD